MIILRAEDHRRMPWKNGKGVTIAIAIHPADASVENFDWRLSTATVDSDGPFSVFEGIERSLSVLTGDGLVLSVEGREDAALTIDSAP
ncbi:HutD family protein [Paracoccus cavernae]|uniref:HutD family protein n=2 Tax=Paracoccus cavernae TaxID=1571207 RepID=A0ABT8D6S3_9RHOB|nr:HutD family protein [Paracoccus cavernae]